MALLHNLAVGDGEDAREFLVVDEAAIYGTCPTCGREHGAGPCVEDGDHIVCACGQMHEADHCPTANGHGMVL